MATAMVREGLRFGRLVVSHEDTPYFWRGRFARRRWSCDCDCGGSATVREDRLKAETTLSCGCLRDDASRERQYRHGGKSGGRATPEYQVWQSLLHRQQEAPVCRRWQAANGRGYAAFLADVGPRPDADHRLVRRNAARAYSPGNCAWEHAPPRRGTPRHFVEYRGRMMSLGDAAAATGIDYRRLCKRLERGWPAAEALRP
ncbi:hypothetical protein QWZ14_18325 [Paeniroseomonas aquatica]|uniref:HNH endonuclease n=1 Tax=Paeniroseomonas aquatica TaxID=373043 RepID=A0ABT8A947_9PROT|nr:hypothetical protein [Paeniroseomonas aquatica]MDN3566332.1 hypothetical protein [Paeniroseomonas aquatica]